MRVSSRSASTPPERGRFEEDPVRIVPGSRAATPGTCRHARHPEAPSQELRRNSSAPSSAVDLEALHAPVEKKENRARGVPVLLGSEWILERAGGSNARRRGATDH